MRFPTFLLVVVLLPAASPAQTPLPQNDLTISLGWSGAEYDAMPDYEDYGRWEGSLFAGVSVGHYWNPHVKTEIEAAWTSPTRTETYEDIVIGGARTYALGTYKASDLRFSLGQAYQFGRNEWIHPFVGVGADIVRRHTEISRDAQTRQSFSSSNQRTTDVRIPPVEITDTRALVRPYLKGGWKMYASDRMYFTTELKLGFAPDLDHALWKIGMGFDF